MIQNVINYLQPWVRYEYLKRLGNASLLVLLTLTVYAQNFKINRIPEFENVNHPEIAYWLFSPKEYTNDKYLKEIDYIAAKGKFTLIFLSARQGANFYDAGKMKPIFSKLVAYAHTKGLKMGLQLNEDEFTPVALPNTERIITEYEVALNAEGSASLTANAKHVRHMERIMQSDLLRAYAFKKTAEGFYQTGTMQDITSKCEATSVNAKSVGINIKLGKQWQGYTVYVMAQHYFNYSSNHSADAAARFYNILNQYKDIPFDGIALDEFTNLRLTPDFELRRKNEVLRERSYSLSMAQNFQQNYKRSLEKTLFDMRYAPEGKPELRAKAINYYMAEMRSGPLKVETAVYKKAKALFGKTEFAGFHDTHHNKLDGDEIWQTGINWWNLPREYGQTDEESPIFTQLGIAKVYPQKAMYNMYYSKKLDILTRKALTDLSYGVRTHYHAINDYEGWGISINTDTAVEAINKVENCTRLLNHFNPSLPKTSLLILFGTEALANWYPKEEQRGRCDINDKLFIEEKAKAIWQAGYRNVLMPTDLIQSGKLKINADGKAEISGHTFDAILFLYPQYSRQTTLKFLELFIQKGGKLMTEGAATNDFDGNNLAERWKAISLRAVATQYNVNKLADLGITQDTLKQGVVNEDGSYVFYDAPSLFFDQATVRTFTHKGSIYSITYKGLAAFDFDKATGNVSKLAITGLTELNVNGKELIKLNKPADVFAIKQSSEWLINMVDPNQDITSMYHLP